MITMATILIGMTALALQTCPANAQETRDLIIHIKNLTVISGTPTDWGGWYRGWPDPYALITVWSYTVDHGFDTFQQGRTDHQDNVGLLEEATELQCSHMLFKNLVPRLGDLQMQFGIWDANTLGVPDEGMCLKEPQLVEAKDQTLEVVGDRARMTLVLTFVPGCTGGKTLKDGGYTPGKYHWWPARAPTVQYGYHVTPTIDVDVDEVNIPSKFVVVQRVPFNWTYTSHSPGFPLVSYEDLDGSTQTVLKWTYEGNDVRDVNISWTMKAPQEAGSYFFCAYVETWRDSTLFRTIVYGDQEITVVEEPVVGGFELPVDKLGLLVPYIGLASIVTVATVATVITCKRAKRRKEKK
jgi:hypothetical protein